MNGLRRTYEGERDPESIKKRAVNDPEVQAILNDPVMQLILQQMQEKPESIRE